MSIIVFEIHGYKAGFTADTHNVTVPLFFKYLSIFPPLKVASIYIPKRRYLFIYKTGSTHVVYRWTVYWDDILEGQHRLIPC